MIIQNRDILKKFYKKINNDFTKNELNINKNIITLYSNQNNAEYYFIIEKNNITLNELKKISKSCFKEIAKKFPLGFSGRKNLKSRNFFVYCLFIVPEISEDIKEYMKKVRTWHQLAFEIPLIYLTKTNEFVCFDEGPTYGSLYSDYIKNKINEMFLKDLELPPNFNLAKQNFKKIDELGQKIYLMGILAAFIPFVVFPIIIYLLNNKEKIPKESKLIIYLLILCGILMTITTILKIII